MSGFPYDSIPDYQKWTIVSDADDRSNLCVQGPVKFALSRDAKIASAGSGFAGRIAERLRLLGANYFVAELSSAPFAARYGDVDSARHLQQLLDRALGRFDPLERVWETPHGRFLDPFRPSIEATGFAGIAPLEEDRRRHLAAVRRLFAELDVFVFTLGSTEIWSDARDGAVFPSRPEPGHGAFDAARYAYSNSDVTDTCAALEAFLGALGEINPGARVILTVDPVAIAATMEPMHVARASTLTKSILKVAAETTAGRHANVDYFAAYDTVIANLAQEQLFASDGRHVLEAVTDRVTQLLLECYFAGTPAASRAPSPAPHITHPLPLYFAGDSAVLAFRHGLFTLPEFDRPFLGCALHVPSLRASELSDECGRLNASLVEQLLSISILMRDDKSSFRVTNYDRISRTGAERLAFDPPLLLFCGANDVSVLLQELGQRSVAVPPEASGGRACEARPDDWPFEDAKAVALGLFERFECGLRILQSFGFRDLAVHSVVAAPDIAEHVHAATMVVNAAIAEICARAGVIYVEICPQAGGRNGVRDEPAMLSVRRLIDMMEARAADGSA